MSANEAEKNDTFSLLLPGKVLHPNALSHLRKFRDCGDKPGAVRDFEVIQENELRKLVSIKPQRGANMVRCIHVYKILFFKGGEKEYPGPKLYSV